MKWHNFSIRVGTLAVLTAMLLRFALSGAFGNAWGLFAQPELASFLVYSETGRSPEPTPPVGTTTPTQTEPSTTVPGPTEPGPTESTPTEPKPTEPKPTEPKPTEPKPTTPKPTEPKPTVPSLPDGAMFTSEDTKYFSVTYSFDISSKPNIKKLLTQKLSWNLIGNAPTVLIVHSHGTEAYTKTADSQYQNHAAYRTTDDRYNMISIGDELTRLLEAKGIQVIHDRTAHDYLDYDNAYEKSRASIQDYLKKYPSIKVVLDLHRDAVQNSNGTQWATKATVNGKDAAQLMLVVGSNSSGQANPNWQTNLSFAEKLAVLMEKANPGMNRPVQVRYKRYNQDLGPTSLIVEVGTAGNTHAQAMNAMPALADAIYALAKGT